MRRVAASVVVAALLSAACSSGDSSDGAVPSSMTSTSTTSTTSTTATTEAAPEEDSPADVWVDLWAAATTEGSTVVDLEAFATPEVAGQVMTIATIDERNRRQVLNSPNSDPSQTVGESTVEDCAFLTPPQAETAANFFRGTGSVDDIGVFRFHSFEVVSRTGCIPAELNEAVLRDYADYWDGLNEISNPPDPDSPRLTEIAAGEHLANVRRLTAADAAAGRYFVDRPTIHPEVIEWRTPTSVVVLDCAEADPNFGTYDAVTNERIGEDPASKPGQRNYYETTLELDGGRWKVTDRQASADTTCDFAPTPRGLPIV